MADCFCVFVRREQENVVLLFCRPFLLLRVYPGTQSEKKCAFCAFVEGALSASASASASLASASASASLNPHLCGAASFLLFVLLLLLLLQRAAETGNPPPKTARARARV